MDRPAVYPADDMHEAMRVLELGLRNVRVTYNKSDVNRAYAASFQRLQSRLLVLREQAAKLPGSTPLPWRKTMGFSTSRANALWCKTTKFSASQQHRATLLPKI